jgi:hypothetical protein
VTEFYLDNPVAKRQSSKIGLLKRSKTVYGSSASKAFHNLTASKAEQSKYLMSASKAS